MTGNSRDESWETVRALEDLLALVARIDDRRKVIRLHSWQSSSFGAIYDEATAMHDDLNELRECLGSAWEEIYGRVTSK